MVFSVVIPICNEEQTLPELLTRLCQVLDRLAGEAEVIMVNDGSRDGSLELLREASLTDSRIRVLDLSRNFGHQAAISAGIDHSSGAAVIVMDGDLQDPPELIPEFIRQWQEGAEVVYAVRRTRKENIFKRAAYRIFYRLLNRISYLEMPLDAGDFSLMDRRVVDHLKAIPERNRFVRGLRTWIGFRQVGIPYDRDERFAGRPQYTLRKLFGLALSGMVSFSIFPLRLAASLGFAVMALAFAGVVLYLVKFLMGGEPRGFPTLIISILFLGGVQLMTIGILGEYIGRIYEEVKGRPLYVVGRRIGFDD